MLSYSFGSLLFLLSLCFDSCIINFVPIVKMEKEETVNIEKAESGDSVPVQEEEPEATMNLQAYLALAVCNFRLSFWSYS